MLTKEGSTPNEAIEKIATKNQLGPEMVRRVSEAYNKSKSVHMLKQASPDDRPKSFPLADPAVIIHNMFVPKMEKAASAEPMRLPSRDFSRADVRMPLLEKRASALRKPTLTPSSALQRYEKYNSMCSLLKQAFYDKLLNNKRQFHVNLEKAAEEVHPLSPGAFRKLAQMVVNGYPDNGQQLMTLLAAKTRKPEVVLQKTAHAVVFPRKDPYITISKVFEYAQKVAEAQTDYMMFVKEADAGSAGLKAFLGHAAGSRLSKGLPEDPGPGKDDEVLDPVTFNRLKEMEAKRVLMGLILHDEDFQQYRYGDMVKAYNNAVQSVPEAYNNPVVLKNLMVKNLESSGVKDIFELKQEAELGKTMGEASDRRRAEAEPPDREEELKQTRSEAFAEIAGKIPGNPLTEEARSRRSSRSKGPKPFSGIADALSAKAFKEKKVQDPGKPAREAEKHQMAKEKHEREEKERKAEKKEDKARKKGTGKDVPPAEGGWKNPTLKDPARLAEEEARKKAREKK
jgi:hypothetical protein